MQDVIPFAFEEELVRCVMRDSVPWFVGRDVCRCLEINNESKALATLDADEREAGVTISDPSGTKYAIVISEPGVYRLVFRSRKPAAERFKRWLAHDVLPTLRRTGNFSLGAGDSPADGRPPVPQVQPMTYRERLDTVAEARMTAGLDAARIVWRHLGLPPLPAPPPSLVDEARACLRHLLGSRLSEDEPIRTMIEAALEDLEEQRVLLVCGGIRVETREGREGFLVANRHTALDAVFKGTRWAGGNWMRPLRRLPEVEAAGPTRFGGYQWRATFIPARYLDPSD